MSVPITPPKKLPFKFEKYSVDSDSHIELRKIDLLPNFIDDFDHFRSHFDDISGFLGWLSVIYIVGSHDDVAVFDKKGYLRWCTPCTRCSARPACRTRS